MVPRVPWRPLTPSSWCSGRRRDDRALPANRCTPWEVEALPQEARGGAVSLATILALPEWVGRSNREEIRRGREGRGPGGVRVGARIWRSRVRIRAGWGWWVAGEVPDSGAQGEGSVQVPETRPELTPRPEGRGARHRPRWRREASLLLADLGLACRLALGHRH